MEEGSLDAIGDISSSTVGNVIEFDTDNVTHNISDLDEYIERKLGARHLPLTTIIPISIVYGLIFVVGVLGNVSTCLVILRNKYMQTPTNVYLANLAVSDLLTHLVGKSACYA